MSEVATDLLDRAIYSYVDVDRLVGLHAGRSLAEARVHRRFEERGSRGARLPSLKRSESRAAFSTNLRMLTGWVPLTCGDARPEHPDLRLCVCFRWQGLGAYGSPADSLRTVDPHSTRRLEVTMAGKPLTPSQTLALWFACCTLRHQGRRAPMLVAMPDRLDLD